MVLAGLPPTHITVAQCDVVRDEAMAFAEKLKASGTPSSVKEFEGAHHRFVFQAPVAAHYGLKLDIGDRAIVLLVAQLQHAFRAAGS